MLYKVLKIFYTTYYFKNNNQDCNSCKKWLFKDTCDHNYQSSSTYGKFVNLR